MKVNTNSTKNRFSWKNNTTENTSTLNTHLKDPEDNKHPEENRYSEGNNVRSHEESHSLFARKLSDTSSKAPVEKAQEHTLFFPVKEPAYLQLLAQTNISKLNDAKSTKGISTILLGKVLLKNFTGFNFGDLSFYTNGSKVHNAYFENFYCVDGKCTAYLSDGELRNATTGELFSNNIQPENPPKNIFRAKSTDGITLNYNRSQKSVVLRKITTISQQQEPQNVLNKSESKVQLLPIDFEIKRSINMIENLLSEHSQKYFRPLLTIQPIKSSKISGSGNTIIVADLDGSFGREVLALIQSGCVTLDEECIGAFVRLLNLEGEILLHESKHQLNADYYRCDFQHNKEVTGLINILSKKIQINQTAPKYIVIFMGDILNDRLTNNQVDTMSFRTRIKNSFQDHVIYLAGNHEFGCFINSDVDFKRSKLDMTHKGHRSLMQHGFFAIAHAKLQDIKTHLMGNFVAAYFDQQNNILFTHAPIFEVDGEYQTLFGTFSAKSARDLVMKMNNALLNTDFVALAKYVLAVQSYLRVNDKEYKFQQNNGLTFESDERVIICHGHTGFPNQDFKGEDWTICANSNHNQPFALTY